MRLSSEFDQSPDRKKLGDFIIHSELDILEKHFITPDMVYLCVRGRIDNDYDDFISHRDEYLKSKEREFVKTMEIIKYIE